MGAGDPLWNDPHPVAVSGNDNEVTCIQRAQDFRGNVADFVSIIWLIFQKNTANTKFSISIWV